MCNLYNSSMDVYMLVLLLLFFLSEGDYKVAMSFMQIKSEVHVVAEIACHQIQSVEKKSTKAYVSYSFLRCEGNLSFSHMC